MDVTLTRPHLRWQVNGVFSKLGTPQSPVWEEKMMMHWWILEGPHSWRIADFAFFRNELRNWATCPCKNVISAKAMTCPARKQPLLLRSLECFGCWVWSFHSMFGAGSRISWAIWPSWRTILGCWMTWNQNGRLHWGEKSETEGSKGTKWIGFWTWYVCVQSRQVGSFYPVPCRCCVFHDANSEQSYSHAAVPGFATMRPVSGLWPWQGQFSCRLWLWLCPSSWPSNISSATLPGDCSVIPRPGAFWPWKLDALQDPFSSVRHPPGRVGTGHRGVQWDVLGGVGVFHIDISPNSSGAEWGSQFFQETGFVPSWFSVSFWFRLGFRGLSPYFYFFLGQGIVFHHDLLVPSGSGSGSRACFPTFLFFLFSEKGFCSIMISWFLLVLAKKFQGFVSLLLGFRGLSPYFFLISCLRKGIVFHHDLLVPSGSGSGSRACFPTFLYFLFSGKGFCSIMIFWFLLVLAKKFGGLSPYF